MPNIDKKLLEKVSLPYTSDELAALCVDSAWTNIFQIINAQNFFLIEKAELLRQILQGEIANSNEVISPYFYPAKDLTDNYSALALNQWKKLMLQTPCEVLPCLDIVYRASRSTASLVDRLGQIHPSGFLLEARRSSELLFQYFFNKSAVFSNELQYHNDLTELFLIFSESCQKNAAELCACENDIRHMNTLKASQQKSAHLPRLAHFSEPQCRFAQRIWKKAQDDIRVQQLSGKTRCSFENAYAIFQNDLADVEILSFADFKRCLVSSRNRKNYQLKLKSMR